MAYDDKHMDTHDLSELEKNIATRVRVDMVYDKVKELSDGLTQHMEKEDIQRGVLDKKILYLFLIASGNLMLTGGGDVAQAVIKMFM